MQFIDHPEFKLRPMTCVDVDAKTFLDHLFETSESIKRNNDIFIEDVIIKDITRPVDLDPGGIYRVATPHTQFTIDGFKFDIQLSKVGYAIILFERAKERMPGVQRFAIWHRNLIISTGLHEKVLEKLEELEMESETLHAKLDEEESLDKAAADSKGHFVRIKPKGFVE